MYRNFQDIEVAYRRCGIWSVGGFLCSHLRILVEVDLLYTESVSSYSMVKFAKQLELLLVPEWKDAYCNYKALKRDVKRVKEDRSRRMQSSNVAPSMARSGTLGRTVTRTFTHVATFKHNVENQMRNVGSSGRLSSAGSSARSSGVEPLRPDDSFIAVHRIEADCNGDPQFEQYETESLDPLQPGEADRQFFKRLDAQLNKVNRFYRMKEAQFVARGKRLEQQLLTLFQVQEEHARQRQMFGPKSKDHDSDDSEEDDDDDEVDDAGLTASSKGDESPLLHSIVTVKSGEPLSRVNEAKPGDEELTTSEEDEEVECSLDAKMVSFAEEAEATEEPDEYALAKSISLKKSSSHRRSSEPQYCKAGSNNHAINCDESPFRSVVNKADFRSPLQPDVRVTVVKDEEEGSEAQHSKLKTILKEPKSAIQDVIDLSLSKKKLATSEKMLCKAFIEFYRGLTLLKSYSSLNLVAFAKIMKKYDKAVKLRLGPVYLNEVERSYFATSNKVIKTMVRVEDIFTKSFSSHDRQKAMAKLRPQRQHSGHIITFFLGLFSGVSILLLIGFIVMLCVSPEVRAQGDVRYMNTVFFVFSSLGLILLHVYLYGWNLYAWQQTRINYPFIFEFRPGTELRYRQVLCVASGFTSLLLAAMNAHLFISTKEAPRFNVSELIPLATVLVFLITIFAPVNLLYRSARVFLIRCLQRLILAPFFKVVLADFFLGDQLTSQVFLFRNIQFMICYYSSSFFRDRVNDGCGTKNPFRELVYFFSMLPYWFRFLQCLRRYCDERDSAQLWNAGKYASALLAVLIRTRYVERGTTIWLVLFVLFSIIAMLYQLYWDLVIDWGLLQPYSQNPWLRDQLVLKKKYLYFISMAVNTVLRVAWLSSIQSFNFIPGLSRSSFDCIFAALELIRRGHWNFYRLENEHLNNVGKYRAVKSVPLPFDESDGAFV